LAREIPPRVLMSLFMMDWRDDDLVAQIRLLHDEVVEWVTKPHRVDETLEHARLAAAKINENFIRYVERRQQAQENAGGPAAAGNNIFARALGREDAVAATREMFLGVSEATVRTIVDALHQLVLNPQRWHRLRAERGQALEEFADEIFSRHGAVRYDFRVANRDHTLKGQRVKRGQLLLLIDSSLRHGLEPVAVNDPSDLRPPPRNGGKQTLARITTLGAALRRAELVETLDVLLDRVDELQLDGTAAARQARIHSVRSYRPLFVVLSHAK
jgi:cytochrome P450